MNHTKAVIEVISYFTTVPIEEIIHDDRLLEDLEISDFDELAEALSCEFDFDFWPNDLLDMTVIEVANYYIN